MNTIDPEQAVELLKKILLDCYVDYSHGRKDLLVIDGIVEITPEDDQLLEAIAATMEETFSF